MAEGAEKKSLFLTIRDMSGAIEISDRKIEKPTSKYDIAREDTENEVKKKEEELKKEIDKQIFKNFTNQIKSLKKQLVLNKDEWDKFEKIEGEEGRTSFILNSLSPEWARVGVLHCGKLIRVRVLGNIVSIENYSANEVLEFKIIAPPYSTISPKGESSPSK